MEFTALERAAIEQFLSKPVEGMDILRQQFAAASVLKRDYTGVGFYTTIFVPRSVPPAPTSDDLDEQLSCGACGVVKSDPDEVIDFLLWTDGGYLACLEALTMKGDSWPDEGEIEIVPSFLRKNDDRPKQGRIASLLGKLFGGRRR